MKFHVFATTAALLILLAAANPAGASEQAAGKDTAGQAAPASVEKPAVVLPELQYEFDPVVDGTQVTHGFKIKNTGDGPLAILQVKTG